MLSVRIEILTRKKYAEGVDFAVVVGIVEACVECRIFFSHSSDSPLDHLTFVFDKILVGSAFAYEKYIERRGEHAKGLVDKIVPD